MISDSLGRSVLESLRSSWISAAVSCAARLEIADVLASAPLTIHDLSCITATHEEACGRLVRALSTIGLFHIRQDGKVALTDKGRLLTRRHPRSLYHVALLYGHWFQRAWTDIESSLRDGANAFERVYGMGMFEKASIDPDFAQAFHGAMSELSLYHADAFREYVDFGSSQHVVDVGGGEGVFLRDLLESHAHLTGTLIEVPEVIQRAEKALGELPVRGRLQLVEQDFFKSVPSGGDTYLLKYIIHDWPDKEALQILENVREAMPQNGRLVIFDAIIPDDGQRHFAPFLDLHMLIVLGGRERTEQEFRELLRHSGFLIENIIRTEEVISCIMCRPAH